MIEVKDENVKSWAENFIKMVEGQMDCNDEQLFKMLLESVKIIKKLLEKV